MVRLALLLVLASPGVLDDLFDPAAGPGLTPYESLEKLGPTERLRARGFDPDRYHAPPPAPDQVEQVGSIRAKLYPGFTYAARLEEKQRVFARMARGVPLPDLARLVWRAGVADPGVFAGKYWKLVGGVQKRDRIPSQRLQALRESERQFNTWFLADLARRIAAESGDERDEALDLLIVKGLGDPDPAVRARCARVLGGLRDERVRVALERAVRSEREPVALGEAIRGRVRQGGRRLEALVRAWMGEPRPDVRFPLVRACRAIPGGWVDELLAARHEAAEGRWRDDLETVRASRLLRAPRVDGPVSFYGIRTQSRRLLFLIDVSGSMKYPMDGSGGTREPRIEKTRRELYRTLGDLPARTRFNVVLFASRPVPWQRTLVPANDRRRDEAIAFLDSEEIRGGTNIHAIVEYALTSGADTAFLLTDGEPSVGVIVDPALIVAESAARNRHGGLVLHTIGLSQDQNAELLVNLAHRNGGTYVAVR